MIDFKKVLTDLTGAALKFDENGKDITLGSVCETALLAAFVDERDLSGEEKTRRALIAMRVHAGEADLTVDEISLTKRLVGKLYPPLVVLRAWEILDPASIK
ncbi:MAG: hypothetical protein FD144_2681 [Rhodospirillaceae bacterium]|nr:MAG: hypothetical protein FD144_2681 [Rhodospirillaceae bacterium]